MPDVALDFDRHAVLQPARLSVRPCTIPRGETRTYDEVANAPARAGRGSIRCAQALGRNPFMIIVPCHRVLEAGNYADKMAPYGGVISKRRLLTIEGAHPTVSKTLFEVLPPRCPAPPAWIVMPFASCLRTPSVPFFDCIGTHFYDARSRMIRRTLFEARPHFGDRIPLHWRGRATKPFAEAVPRPFDLLRRARAALAATAAARFSELVAGSVLIGHPGDEYVCTHDHVCRRRVPVVLPGARAGGSDRRSADAWQVGAVPPLPELMVLGRAGADGSRWQQRRRPRRNRPGAGRPLCRGGVREPQGQRPGEPARPPPRGGKGAVDRRHSHRPITLDDAAEQAGISPFHFLRLFSGRAGRHPAPISGALAAAPCGAAARR